MGLLDQLAGQIYQGFQGKLRLGTLWRNVPSLSGGVDQFGDPLVSTPTTWPCQGFTDVYSDYFRAKGLVPETDVKVMIFGASLPAGIQPQKDDKVLMVGTWWQLRDVKSDPAFALWTCQAYAGAIPQLPSA